MVTTATIISMFSTFILFVGGVIAITEMFNELFKIENKITKLIISWILSIGLSVLGFVLKLGFFAEFGDMSMWQSWVKVVLVGIGCALAANKIYDREEIWRLLEYIFSFFKKNGKEIRVKLMAKKD